MRAEARLSRRVLLLHGAVYTASRVLNQAATFLLLPLYAHVLGSRGLGIVEVMNVARNLLAVLFLQGLSSAWFRFRFDYPDADSVKRFESTILWYLALTSVVGLGFFWLFGPLLAHALTPGVPFRPLGFLTVCAAAFSVFGVLLESRLQAERRPVAFAVFGLLRTIGTLFAIIVFVAVLGRGAAGKIEAEAVAGFVGALLAIVTLWPVRPTHADWPSLRRSLGYGWALVPHGFAGVANNLIDRFIVNGLLGLSAVGIYSMGYRIAGIGMLVMIAVNQAFSPAFIESMRAVETAAEEGRTSDAEALKKRLASLGFVVVLIGCVVAQVVTALGRELLALVTTPEFSASWRVVAPVSASVVAWAWYGPLSQSITYRPASVRFLPLVTIVAALANVVANYVWVPRFGIDGAAWATLLSNTVLAGLAYFVGMRSLPVPYVLRRWSSVTAWTGLSLALLFWMDTSVASTPGRILAKLGWLAVSSVITFLVSGARVETVRDFFRRSRGEAPPSPT